MTPKLWHKVAKIITPAKRRLLVGVILSGASTAIFFTFAGIHQEPNKWLFLSLFLSAIALFWCFGLLLVMKLYGALPDRSAGTLSYYWNIGMGWYGALFLAAWFAGLIFMSVVGPLLVLFNYDR